MEVVGVLLGFASGISVGFTLGRVFERIQWSKKGWKLYPPGVDDELS